MVCTYPISEIAQSTSESALLVFFRLLMMHLRLWNFKYIPIFYATSTTIRSNSCVCLSNVEYLRNKMMVKNDGVTQCDMTKVLSCDCTVVYKTLNTAG